MTGLQPHDYPPVGFLVMTILAAGARFIMSDEPITTRRMVETLLLSIALVFAIYPYIHEKDIGKGMTNLVIASASFLAKDILETLIRLWRQIKTDPLKLLQDWLNRRDPP